MGAPYAAARGPTGSASTESSPATRTSAAAPVGKANFETAMAVAYRLPPPTCLSTRGRVVVVVELAGKVVLTFASWVSRLLTAGQTTRSSE